MSNGNCVHVECTKTYTAKMFSRGVIVTVAQREIQLQLGTISNTISPATNNGMAIPSARLSLNHLV